MEIDNKQSLKCRPLAVTMFHIGDIHGQDTYLNISNLMKEICMETGTEYQMPQKFWDDEVSTEGHIYVSLLKGTLIYNTNKW